MTDEKQHRPTLKTAPPTVDHRDFVDRCRNTHHGLVGVCAALLILVSFDQLFPIRVAMRELELIRNAALTWEAGWLTRTVDDYLRQFAQTGKIQPFKDQ